MNREVRELLIARARNDAARNPSTIEHALTDGSRAVRRRIRRAEVVAIVGTVLVVLLSLGVTTAARGDDRPHATLLEILPSSAHLEPGDSVALGAVATFADRTTSTVTDDAEWTSSDPAVARTDAPGRVVAVGVGAATITATFDGRTGQAEVTVEAAPVAVTLVSVAIAPADAELGPGETVLLSATGTYSDGTTASLTGDLTWASSNGDVVSVDALGQARGQAGGEAVVSLDYQGHHASTNLSVRAAAKKVVLESLTVDPSQTVVSVGEPVRLTATAHFSDGTIQDVTKAATWGVADPKVVSRPEAGLADAIATGSTTVSATWQDETGTSAVTVEQPSDDLEKVVVDPDHTDLCQGKGEVQLSAKGIRAGSPLLVPLDSVTWASDDESLAKVDSDGLVQMLGKDQQTATIVATSEGVSGSATITVVAC